MEQSDLTTCRNVRYTKGWRKGASKCEQCGFWFVPDSQKYPLADSEPVEYLSGVQWFAQFKCCPNCLPAESTAPFGKRRCLGRRVKGRGWTRKRGCGVWFIIENQSHRCKERQGYCRVQGCQHCKWVPWKANLEMALGKARRFLKSHGQSPTVTEWESMGGVPSVHTVMRHFGSWKNFLAVLGATPKPLPYPEWNVKYSNDEVVSALRSALSALGHVPSIREWKQYGFKPSITAIIQRAGSWNHAWEQIGATPNIASDKESVEVQRSKMARARMALNNWKLPSPTAREMWLATHGQASESTKRYLAAVQHHTEKLDEQERIFKEHQFKKSVDTDSNS